MISSPEPGGVRLGPAAYQQSRTGNIILTPMPHIESGSPDLSCPENRAVLAHWMELRDCAPVPARERFNPMRLPRMLPHIIMLEPQGHESAIVRTFGTELARRLGLDLTGIDMVTMYQGPRRRDLMELLCMLRNQQVIAVAHTRWTTPNGHEFTTENLWLPFAGADGEVSRIMGALHEPQAPPANLDTLGGTFEDAQQSTERRYYRV